MQSVDPVPFGHWTLRDEAAQRPVTLNVETVESPFFDDAVPHEWRSCFAPFVI